VGLEPRTGVCLAGAVISQDQLLPQLLRRRATETPGRVFLQQVEGDRTLTYGEAHREALRWAHGFDRLGVVAQETVISMLPVGFDAVHCWVGLNWLVAWEVPVNTAFQGMMLSYTLQNSNARIAVIAERYLDRIVALDKNDLGKITTLIVPDLAESTTWTDAELINRLGITVLNGAAFLDGAGDTTNEPEDSFAGPQPWDVTEIFYTSGTTGPSKGVLYTHIQQHATISSFASTWTEDDCYYCPFPMYHVSGKMTVYAIAMIGMRGVIREYFKTDEFWSDIKHYGCTTTLLLGAMANFIYRQPERLTDSDTPLNKVLMVPLIPELEAFNRRFGTRVNTVFNMTEISSPIEANYDETAGMPVTACGRTRPGYDLRVVDEHDRELPRGTLGELIVRADHPWVLNAGYFNMAEKTAEAWRNGWFHTGDGFIQDADGWFHFVDRQKDAIRRRGENISSMEVEAHVNTHPAVLESAAIAVASEWGEDEVKIVVVLKPSTTVEPTHLHAYLSGIMPKFMLPRFIEFIDALPKTPTEKVRKVALREAGITTKTWDASADKSRS
jgi:carnitine-CoA ligase